MEPVEGAQTFHTCSSTDYTAFMGRYSRARAPPSPSTSASPQDNAP